MKRMISAFGLFCAGAGAGAVVALLYAPQSGKRTRKAVRKFTDDRVDQIEEFGRDLMARGSDRFERVKESVDACMESTMKAIDTRCGSVVDAFQDFRKKVDSRL